MTPVKKVRTSPTLPSSVKYAGFVEHDPVRYCTKNELFPQTMIPELISVNGT